MIVVFRHAESSRTVQGVFFNSIRDFVFSSFEINLDETTGQINIGDYVSGISYVIKKDDNKGYTRQEALDDFANSLQLKRYLKSRFYTIYELKEKLV